MGIVITQQGKIRWMFSIPVMVALVGLIVALWLLPGMASGSRIVGTMACTLVLLLVGEWSIWGDVEQ